MQSSGKGQVGDVPSQDGLPHESYSSYVGSCVRSSFNSRSLQSSQIVHSMQCCLAGSVSCNFATWTLLTISSSFTIGLLQPFETLTSSIKDVTDLAEILPDRTYHWIGYPQHTEPLPLSLTQLTLARCDMTHFVWDIMRLLFSKTSQLYYKELRTESCSLARRMNAWYQGLPKSLQYKTKMPSPLYELQ